MSVTRIDTDYLVIGAGAMGLAFADVILDRTSASLVIVDRLDRPGGHWNHAYPFVRLHQPSAYYGVNSRELGSNRIDEVGRNRGMLELASAHEVLAYFDQLMRQDFLPSGRVRYFPQSEYLGDGRFRSLASGRTVEVTAGKHVDSTYMKVKVPQIDPPKFHVGTGVECVPPNALAKLTNAYHKFVVIGGGKTAIDTCLYLLDLGIDRDVISWIVPRDSWLLDRAKVQPDNLMDNILKQIGAIAQSTSLTDMFARVEESGALIRIDPSVEPTMYRCATVSQAEVDDLRKIRDVVRMGRVQGIETGRMSLDQGSRSYPTNSLFINCTSDGLEKRPTRPVFDGRNVTLQAVRPCQQLFAAAFIGYVESAFADEATKNGLCEATPHPDTQYDYLRMIRDTLVGQVKWASDPELLTWLKDARLDGFTTPEVAQLLASAGQPSSASTFEMIHTALRKIGEYLEEEPSAAA
jgi:hypothetical protein